MRISMLFFSAMLLASPFVQATENEESAGRVIDTPVLADDAVKFGLQSEWATQEMNPGGRYEFIKPSDKQRVIALLNQMSNLLANGPVEAMNRDTRSQLLNGQEEVNGILKHSDSNRLVCESHEPTGSHRMIKTCRTYAQTVRPGRNTQASDNDGSRQCGKGATQYSSRYGASGNSGCGGR